MVFRPGTMVWLSAFEEEPRQQARVLSYDKPSQTYVVRLLPDYRDKANEDDGLREVSKEQVEGVAY